MVTKEHIFQILNKIEKKSKNTSLVGLIMLILCAISIFVGVLFHNNTGNIMILFSILISIIALALYFGYKSVIKKLTVIKSVLNTNPNALQWVYPKYITRNGVTTEYVVLNFTNKIILEIEKRNLKPYSVTDFMKALVLYFNASCHVGFSAELAEKYKQNKL